jgi:Tc5 transposase DNA-binding domain.
MAEVLHTWFTAMCSQTKTVTGSMIIHKAISFYDEMTIIDKCTFIEGWLQNFKEPAAKGISKWNTSLVSCADQVQQH